jgi:hypothetical protein
LISLGYWSVVFTPQTGLLRITLRLDEMHFNNLLKCISIASVMLRARRVIKTFERWSGYETTLGELAVRDTLWLYMLSLWRFHSIFGEEHRYVR